MRHPDFLFGRFGMGRTWVLGTILAAGWGLGFSATLRADEYAARAVTREWFEGRTLTPEQTQVIDSAKAAAFKDPAVAETLAKLKEMRKAYQANQDKYPADRDKTVGGKYRAALKAADTELRRAMLAADPSLEPLLSPVGKKGQKNEGEDDTDSETGNKAAMVPIKDAAGLPRVLLIGDSISIGYTLPVRERLKGKANVHRIPINGGATEVGLDKINEWLGDGKWDVIHFNFGLHDAKYMSETEVRATRDQYLENLQKLVDRMKATGAKLIFATTTPTPAKFSRATRRFDSIPERNEIAATLMKKNGVEVEDLYAVVVPVQEKIQRPGDVHFAPEGYNVLADVISKTVEANLPPSSQP